MSTSNDLRGQRALQLLLGVALGITIGLGMAALLGASAQEHEVEQRKETRGWAGNP